jgi:outer membrane lipoprotein-sorting protein
MKFLRTASTARLLAVIAGLIAAVAAGTAIALAATGSGPVPRSEPLATAVHTALSAKPVTGISADISFTNNLISSADFPGQTADPILQGATGRLWLSGDRLRLELQSDNGDAQVVVDNRSFWISDPAQGTVYEGALPAAKPAAKSGSGTSAVPSISQIQSELTRLMSRVDLTGADTSGPTDVAGRPAYSVSVSPKHDGGLLGSLRLAWDAVRGVPLDVAIYARGNATPVLELKATNISYGAVPASVFALTPPAGDKVVRISAPAAHSSAPGARAGAHAKAKHASGVAAVAAQLPFTLVAPSSLVGLPRHSVNLLSWGGSPAAAVVYGRDVGAIAVIEQQASTGSSGSGPSGDLGGLNLPTVSINGATGEELDTALGTVVHFSTGGVAYTVIGSVAPYAADQAARALTP